MATDRKKSLPSQLSFPVVGIGASAGGFEALKPFFEALPGKTGAAYVIVFHLSPDHTSSLAAMLQGLTAMPVTAVTKATHIERDHVYVIAPSLDLTMEDSYLHVQPSARENRGVAIDLFFRSLAHAHRERAVSIVLSGAGSDGSVGLARVKELGGITFAQSPEEAEHASMPRAAIGTGTVDVVLPVGEIPPRLQHIWNTARAIRLPDSGKDVRGAAIPVDVSERAATHRAPAPGQWPDRSPAIPRFPASASGRNAAAAAGHADQRHQLLPRQGGVRRPA
jgi:two-component system CheB/CheR fusion protein